MLARPLAGNLAYPLSRPLIGKSAASSSRTYDLTSQLPDGCTFTRASIGTYTNVTGNIAQATTDAARFDYHPITHDPLGLLIEPARTNLFIRSEELHSTPWTASAFTVGTNVGVAPTGATTAESFLETAVSNQHNVLRATLTLTGTGVHPCIARIFLKPRGATQWVKVRIDDGNATNQVVYANFDIINGVVGNSGTTYGTITIQSAAITPVGNGWYMCEIAFTTVIFVNWVRMILYTTASNDSAGFESHAGNTANGFYAWGTELAQDIQVLGTYIPTTSATVTRAADVLTIPMADGVYDITTTDAAGSATVRTSVVTAYTVTPRSGQTHVKTITAVKVGTYAGYDSDAKTWLHANQIVSFTGRAAVNNTVAAIKSSSIIAWDDIAFAGLAPGRNKDTGTTVKTLGGWTAALIDGTLSNASLMRNGNAYGLYTNNGDTTTDKTRIDFPSVPLGSTYAVVAIVSPMGNTSSERALFSVGGNVASVKQIGSTGLILNADSGYYGIRGLHLGRANALGMIQEAASVGRLMGEYGYNRTTTMNITGTNTIYVGAQFISSAATNTQVGGNTEVYLEAIAWMQNPSEAKVTELGAILKSTLCVQVTEPVNGYLFTGQSQASAVASQMLDRYIYQEESFGFEQTTIPRHFLQQVYQHINRPISDWIGSGPSYSRQGWYASEISPGAAWEDLLAYDNATTTAIIWFQGAADFGYSQGTDDATDTARANAYQARLTAFMGFLNADYPNAIKVIVQDDWVNTGSYTLTANELACLATVRAAQAAVATATGAALVDTRGMARSTSDGIHLTNAGNQAMVEAVWLAIKNYEVLG